MTGFKAARWLADKIQMKFKKFKVVIDQNV